MSRLKHARAHAMHAAAQRDVPVTVAIRDKALHVTASSPGDAWMLAPIICADPLTPDPTGTVLSGLSRLNQIPVHVTVA